MIFPIGDTQVKGGPYPFFSYALIVLNSIIFILQMLIPGNLVCEYAIIPQHIIDGSDWHTLLTSLFLHGGYLHILGNLLFLWVFADNIESTIGNFKFLIFYLGGGIIASLVHIFIDGQGSTDGCCKPCIDCQEQLNYCQSYIPSIGASGAISAVMGAYMIMFPASKIKVLVIFLFRSFFISAWIFLAIWFGQQMIAGMGSTLNIKTNSNQEVAWWAHIGGFTFGIISGWYFKNINKISFTSQNV